MALVGPLIFLLTLLAVATDLAGAVYAGLRRRPASAGRRLLLAAGLCGLYIALLATVSLLSPQQVLAMRQKRCFDDWCLAVEQVARRPVAGGGKPLPAPASPRGYYLVTVRVSSDALRASQRALDVAVYLTDGRGRRYDPTQGAQQALEARGLAGPPFNMRLEPGGSFTRTVAFDVPDDATGLGLVVTHGLFPDRLLIGNSQSYLHPPTLIRLAP